MKTLHELQKQHNDLTAQMPLTGESKFLNDREIKKMQKEAKFLKECILFLETNPKFEVVKSWLEESERILDLVNDNNKFHDLIKNTKNQNPEKISAGLENTYKAEYERLFEKSKYRNQVKTLRFILS